MFHLLLEYLLFLLSLQENSAEIIKDSDEDSDDDVCPLFSVCTKELTGKFSLESRGLTTQPQVAVDLNRNGCHER